jgi:hypothetical protein
MTSLHETQISKARKIAGYTISIIASFMLFMAGIMKIIGNEEMKINKTKVTNFGDKLMLIGILEIIILILFWIPRTMNIGFFLLASFGGGIIVAEIVTGEMPFAGILVTTLFYVGSILRKPTLSGLNI